MSHCMRYHNLWWAATGAKLTVLSEVEADDIGAPEAGPFKPDHYRS